MNRCLIHNCKSVGDPLADQPGGVRFFEFPLDVDLRRKWSDIIEAYQGPLLEFGAVCERHFEPAAFLPNGSDLTPDAVPNMNLPASEISYHDDKSLLELLAGCVVTLESGGVCCGLEEDSVPCTFTQERFESRSLLQHICYIHTAFAVSVGLIDEQTAKAKVGTTNAKKRIRNRIMGWQNKVLDHVSKEADGFRCRIEGSDCTYVLPGLIGFRFARHFRRKHPVQAFDYGYFEGFRREEIYLDESARLLVIKSKVDYDGKTYRCNISSCNYWVRSFNTEVIRQHICKKHAAIANHYALLNNTPPIRSPKRRKIDASSPTESKHGPLSSEVVQMVKENIELDGQGTARCRISGADCRYCQKSFDASKFFCHFCLRHPNELRAKGLCSVVQNERKSSSSESEASSTSTDTEDDFDEQSLLQSTVPEESSDVLPQTAENEDSKLVLTTPSDDPSSYCRLCFSVAQPLQSIFAETENGAELIELISSCTNIRLCATTDAPSSICVECHQKLDEIQRFRQLAEMLDNVVRQQGRLSKDLDLECDEELAESDHEMEENQSVECLSDTSVSDSEDDAQASSIHKELIKVKVRDKRYFKCPACGFLGRFASHIDQHWRHVHEGGTDMSKQTTCTVDGCAEIFFHRNNLKRHLKLVHDLIQSKRITVNVNAEQKYVQLAENQFICRNCGQLYDSIQQVVDHFQRNHRLQKYVIDRGPSSSANSESEDDTQSSMTLNHRQLTKVTVRDKSYYKCPACDFLARFTNNIQLHWKHVHKGGGTDTGKQITCTQDGCTAVFFLHRNLKQHLKLVHNFSHKTVYLDAEHMYIQLAENHFTCRSCGQFFESKKLAVDHFQRSHRARRHVVMEKNSRRRRNKPANT